MDFIRTVVGMLMCIISIVFIKFKFAKKKGKYIIVAKDLKGIEKYTKEHVQCRKEVLDFV